MTSVISPNELRQKFVKALSEMYSSEVPQYAEFRKLVAEVNSKALKEKPNQYDSNDLNTERHGAIRLGSEDELFNMRRLFAQLGMFPVDYYDLSASGIPVHSTAFRPIHIDDLKACPFRVFTSLLRLDLITDAKLREKAAAILATRDIFSSSLKQYIEDAENNGGIKNTQADEFIHHVIETFRWHQNATVDSGTYADLKATHGLVADIVSFQGPHINHLTPSTYDIDNVQAEFVSRKIKAKASIEGPPQRNCSILLRQTSFLALAENVEFTDKKTGKHTARFGEVEQRGVALTPKGRALYDQLLHEARKQNNKYGIDHKEALQTSFKKFPDSHFELYQQDLAYYTFERSAPLELHINHNNLMSLIADGSVSIKPIQYEDFLPVSAAGIFVSNLADTQSQALSKVQAKSTRNSFEKALGCQIHDSFSLYSQLQKDSMQRVIQNSNFS